MIYRIKTISALALMLLLSSCSTSPTVERKTYYPWENDYGYSQVVKADNTLYISGVASDKPSFPEQIKEIYTFIHRILGDYGINSDAIVKQVIYTTDTEGMKAHTKLRKTFFNEGKYPSSSIVQVSRLYEEGHLLEVEIVAIMP